MKINIFKTIFFIWVHIRACQSKTAITLDRHTFSLAKMINNGTGISKIESITTYYRNKKIKYVKGIVVKKIKNKLLSTIISYFKILDTYKKKIKLVSK